MNNSVMQAKRDAYFDAHVTIIEALAYEQTFDDVIATVNYTKHVSYYVLEEEACNISYVDGIYHNTYIDTVERLLNGLWYANICNDTPDPHLAEINTNIADTTTYFLNDIIN